MAYIENRIRVWSSQTNTLRDRLLVSKLDLLERSRAKQEGYIDSDVIVSLPPGRPTTTEAQGILDHPSTYLIELTSLPIHIGNTAISLDTEEGFEHPIVRSNDCIDFGNGFLGVPFGHRKDPPGLLNVSVDREEKFVGDHIDALDPRQTVTVINMGPGRRWHRITPGFSKEDIDSKLDNRRARVLHMRSLVEDQSNSGLTSYWIRLDPPRMDHASKELYCDALIGIPVARFLHDGATYDSCAVSTAVFIGMPIEP